MRALIFGVALASCVLAACGIGPKQDDPATTDPGPLDASSASDTGGFREEDTANDPAAAEGGADAPSDAKVVDAAPADVGADACPDGGVPLSAMGPWNEGKDCWKGTRVFECVGGIDGGAALTCFVEISTGDLYQAGSTHIPSGSNYRLCNETERAKIDSTAGTCK
jgi:hypothetical protein